MSIFLFKGFHLKSYVEVENGESGYVYVKSGEEPAIGSEVAYHQRDKNNNEIRKIGKVRRHLYG